MPAFGALLRLARSARTLVNRGYHRRVAAALTLAARTRLAALLAVPAGATRSGWDQLKADPPRPSPQRMREHLAHLAWLRKQAVAPEAFAGVPDRKLGQFAAEARSLGAADVGRLMESKRLALMAALLRGQVARALDDAAEMFVRLTTRMHNRAREALDAHRARHAAETDALVALLRETVLACQDRGAEQDARLAVIEGLLMPDADAILAKCEAHAAFAGNNYLPLLTRQYGGQRAAFLRFLAHAAPVSTSQDRGVEQAIAFLLAHRTDRRARLRPVVETVQADGTTARQALDLSWVGERWWPLLTGRTAREPAPAEVDRRYFEICLFTQVVNELKSGDLCIPGSEEYGDYRDQLVSWEEYNRDVAGYAEQAGVPTDPAAFVTALKARLARTADATDSAFPENEQVEIVDGEPLVKRLRAREATDSTAFLEQLLKPRMVPVGVLEALADTEHWLGWTRHFGPVSGFEAKLERPRERYLATVFGAAVAIVLVAALVYFLRGHSTPRAARLLPEADAIVYIDVAPLRLATHFDRDLIARSPDFQHFIDATGIVPERDLDVAAFALHAMADPSGPNGPVAFSEIFIGRFDSARLTAYLTSIASAKEIYAGHTLFDIPSDGRTLRVTQLDARTIAASNCPTPEQIHVILDHARSSGPAPSVLAAHYADVPSLAPAWAIGRIGLPFAENGRIRIAGLELPLAADTELVASLRYTTSLHLRIEQITSSLGDAAQSAQALNAMLALLRTLEPIPSRTDSDKAMRELTGTIRIEQQKERVVLTADPPPDLLKRLSNAQK